jgi:hypothetical protein
MLHLLSELGIFYHALVPTAILTAFPIVQAAELLVQALQLFF